MNKQQYEKLGTIDNYLVNSRYNFVRISRSGVRQVVDLYKEITGKEVTKSEEVCSKCLLRILKEMDSMRLAYEKWLEKFRKKEEPVEKKEETLEEPNQNEETSTEVVEIEEIKE